MPVNRAVYIPPYMAITPFFQPWLPRLAPMGRRSVAALTRIRQCTLSQVEACFGSLFAAPVLIPPRPGDPRRERPYSLRRTFWCILWQMLNENTACREGVRQLQAVLGLHGGPKLDSGNSAYCQARARLPVSLLEGGLSDTALAVDRQAPQRAGLQGRPLKAADGSTVVLADTPENQELYPHLHARDIIVYDRAGGHFVLAAQLIQIKVDLISRVFKRRIDWRRGSRLGKNDRLVVWKKGPQKPAYLTPEQWAAMPEQIPVRVLKVQVSRPGCRTQQLTLMTTLLDPVKYPAQEIAEAYLRRWRLELCLDDLTTTLGMETLRCLSPEMVQKELLAFRIAHNLLRWVISAIRVSPSYCRKNLIVNGAVELFAPCRAS